MQLLDSIQLTKKFKLLWKKPRLYESLRCSEKWEGISDTGKIWVIDDTAYNFITDCSLAGILLISRTQNVFR